MSDNINETLKQRGSKYGEFSKHAILSERLLDTLKIHDLAKFDNLKPYQKESLKMICHKLARIMNGDPDYDDSWRDIAGYATLVVQEINEQWIKDNS